MSKPAAPASAPADTARGVGDSALADHLRTLADSARSLPLRMTGTGLALALAGTVVSTAVALILPGRLASEGGAWIVPAAIGGVWLVVALVGVALLHGAAVRPVREMEGLLPRTPWEPAPAGATAESNALRHRIKVLNTELSSLQTHKHALADEIGRLAETQKSALTTLTAALTLTHDRLLLTDADTRLRDASPTALELLDLQRSDVLGKPFAETVKLYDHTKERPEEHTLGDLVARVLESRSTIPRLEQALLVNRRGGRVPVFVSAAAILDGSTVLGALVRLEPLDKEAVVTTLAGATAQAGSLVDRTTGLPGTQLFERRLEELIKLARSQQAMHALLFLSPDDFDGVNDNHGHWVGEELLWQIAQVLRSESPANADCFRVSSTHLALLVPFTTMTEATKLAERIRITVDGREFKWQEMRYEATVTIGVVPIPPDVEGHKVVVGLANTALAYAKANGGNQVFTQLPDAALVSRRRQDREWVTWVATRLKEGHGHLISQSIEAVAPNSTLPPMLEVLIRIEDEDGAWVQPGAFLPSMVRHNLTAQIDLWMLRRLVKVLVEKPSLLAKHSTVSVNLARSSLTEPDFGEKISEILAESMVPPSHFCFEIDALTAINHPSDVSRFVTIVQTAGSRFALDRCKAALGLNALSTLPIEFVKIHESLVRKAVKNPVDRGYISWINQVTHQLGRKTIATGVEDAATLEVMRQIGIDYAQGVQINKLGPLMT